MNLDNSHTTKYPAVTEVATATTGSENRTDLRLRNTSTWPSPDRGADLRNETLTICPHTVGGIVRVGAAKAAIPGLLALAFASDEPIHMSRMPESSDWTESLEVLRRLGCTIRVDRAEGYLGLEHPASFVESEGVSQPMQSRALLPLTGLLATAGHICLPLPGGCNIGPRPLDLHKKVLRHFGIEMNICSGAIATECVRKTKPHTVVLSGRSVGESLQALVTALGTPGAWPIVHLANAPETRFLVDVLTRLGIARRVNRHSAVVLGGARIPRGIRVDVPSDPIETGNWAILGGLSLDGVYLPSSQDPDLARLLSVLARAGLLIERETDLFCVRRGDTSPKPSLGFVSTQMGVHTDYHSALMAFATTASSWSLFRDHVFPERVSIVREIALSTRQPESLRVGHCLLPRRWRSWRLIWPTVLAARDFRIPDIRTGFAQLLLGLLAQEPFRLHGVDLIRRGFPRLNSNLQALGQHVVSSPAAGVSERQHVATQSE